MSTSTPAQIFLLSDGTGETVENTVKAALTQYMNESVRLRKFKNLRSPEAVTPILEEAKRLNAIVVYTIVTPEVRGALSEGVRERGLSAVDLLGPMLSVFSSHLKSMPAAIPGLLHEVNEDYFKRIEAIEFTVKHDDGALASDLEKADIVLVGVSRTSKTPLSVFLAHKGFKVANVPLVKGIEPPEALYKIDQRKIVGLTIDPEALAEIRKQRLTKLGKDLSDSYANLAMIRSEMEWALEVFSRHRRWPIFDVTNKALEETATEIEKVLLQRKNFTF
ncbi:MAG TPA: pyruvate, water dikinase regulatory protein [Bdellovibrionota bacterium]|nr:pyruvate, water dikinase regulatory protein [Bdellovibrionota bacterium]